MDESGITVMTVREAMENVERIGNKVLLFDDIGSWQGGGVADYCTALGAEVTVVCSGASVGSDIESGQAYLLTKRLYENGAEIIANHVIHSLEGNDVVIENTYNHKLQKLHGFDTLLVAGQSRSKCIISSSKKKEVYFAGDCVAPRGVEQAIFEAEILAREI